MPYRADIDGLRAVAVMAVVLFHVATPGFSGGFVGVDIFFVISGYLITALILREGDRFSLSRFYERRIRRILPALIAVVAVTWILAAVLFLPQPFKDFSQSLVALTLFSTNLLFYSESGYFDAEAKTKPLLHTWSLSVEEQFYLVFPLAFLLLRRWAPRRWTWGIGLIGVGSLAASEWAVRHAADAAYYLPHYRVWELLLGTLLAAYHPAPAAAPRASVRRELAAAAGLCLIGWSIWSFVKMTPFPGFHALVPCLGTALVIYSGSAGPTRIHRLLMHRPVVFVGLISYSLYLWHWPLLTFATYLNFGVLSAWQRGAVVACSVALAVISWRVVEQPFRHGRAPVEPTWRGSAMAAASVCLLLIFGTGLFGQMTDGWRVRHAAYSPPEIRGREDYGQVDCMLFANAPASTWKGAPTCVSDHGAAHTMLLWGDSFGAHYMPGLRRSTWRGANIVQYNQSTCPPVLDANIPQRPFCAGFNDAIWSVITEHEVDTVVLSARWDLYWNGHVTRDSLQRTIDALRQRRLNVILIGQSPVLPVAHPYDYLYRRGTDLVVSDDFEALNRELATLTGVTAFFNPWPPVCRHTRCRLREGEQFYFLDYGHYSSFGSEQMVKLLIPVLERVVTAHRHEA